MIPRISTLKPEVERLLTGFGAGHALTAGTLPVSSPISGEIIGHLRVPGAAEARQAINNTAHAAFLAWRSVPAPQRGELVRLLSEELRAHKGAAWPSGLHRSRQDRLGRPRRSAGDDRHLRLRRRPVAPTYGLTIASERPGHRMMETWHPLGVIGVITAFNFPVAVWSWNTALALVCGDACVWKPSEKTPLTALARQALFEHAAGAAAPAGRTAAQGPSTVLIGGREIGEALVDHPRVPLVSATGSTAHGPGVGAAAGARFARAILELGGNNGVIVSPPPISISRARHRLPPWARLASAAPRCAACSSMTASMNRSLPRLKKACLSVTIGNPFEQARWSAP